MCFILLRYQVDATLARLKTSNSWDMQVFKQEVTMTSVSGVLIVTILVGAAYGNSTSSSVTKIVGQDVTLTCGIPNLSTYPTWTKDNFVDQEGGDSLNTSVSSRPMSLSMSTRIRIDNSSLLLMNLTLDDSATYTCSVPGQGNYTITLTVIQPAESLKKTIVGIGVIILGILQGVLCIMIIRAYKACCYWAFLGWSILLFIASCVAPAAWLHLNRSDELFPWYIVTLYVLNLLTVSTIVIMAINKTQQSGTNKIFRLLNMKLGRSYVMKARIKPRVTTSNTDAKKLHVPTAE
ncbi:uncharacterized protein LOC128240617 isoform X2 [Mya arenaria]|uniref:uncharacterized protein LOC128240617 isoform X2 n=1 Tax=Mya arenaria TaxID=6604 RepID=UPI0022E19807|nr:uncharacterized protein LOC128240617 isoform X2 [Mya arenaria]